MSGETGVVKFKVEHITTETTRFAGFEELNAVRRKLFDRGYIGVNPDGIAFGNVSLRAPNARSFYITGSGTGGIAALTPGHYTKVSACDFSRNWLRCAGAIVASSESLTHAAIYEAAPEVSAIIHCHRIKLWRELLGRVPTTRKEVEYGTPEMAGEVRRLFEEGDAAKHKILAMAGHEGGVIASGRSIADAFEALSKADE